MSTFTEPLVFESTDRFNGGTLRQGTAIVDGVRIAVIELTGARRMMRVTKPFVYEDTRTSLWITIGEGFETDLGSIPGFARFMLSPDDPWAAAFVVHDRLYGLLREGKAPAGIDRAAADLMLWDALGIPYRVYRNGELQRAICPASARTAIYYAVRIGGARAAVENGGRLALPSGA